MHAINQLSHLVFILFCSGTATSRFEFTLLCHYRSYFNLSYHCSDRERKRKQRSKRKSNYEAM